MKMKMKAIVVVVVTKSRPLLFGFPLLLNVLSFFFFFVVVLDPWATPFSNSENKTLSFFPLLLFITLHNRFAIDSLPPLKYVLSTQMA
jgi:hypothetical protein